MEPVHLQGKPLSLTQQAQVAHRGRQQHMIRRGCDHVTVTHSVRALGVCVFDVEPAAAHGMKGRKHACVACSAQFLVKIHLAVRQLKQLCPESIMKLSYTCIG